MVESLHIGMAEYYSAELITIAHFNAQGWNIIFYPTTKWNKQIGRAHV